MLPAEEMYDSGLKYLWLNKIYISQTFSDALS